MNKTFILITMGILVVFSVNIFAQQAAPSNPPPPPVSQNPSVISTAPSTPPATVIAAASQVMNPGSTPDNAPPPSLTTTAQPVTAEPTNAPPLPPNTPTVVTTTQTTSAAEPTNAPPASPDTSTVVTTTQTTAAAEPTNAPPPTPPTTTTTTTTVSTPTTGPSNPPPPAPNGQPGTQYQADVAQFQNWLSNNGQVTSAPPPPIMQPTLPGGLRVVETVPLPERRRTVALLKRSRGASPVVSPPLTLSESQAIMLKSAPAPFVPPDPDSEAAFNALLKQNVPLTPQQVVRLRQFIDNSQRAAAIPATIPPKPVSSTLIINLAPGTTPPAIRISQGYMSSIMFVDSLGSPWPIASYDIGDPKIATIQWDGKSNILLLQGVSPYSDSNFVVRLVGLLTPITLQLVSGQRVVDYRTDIHVPGIGPNSKDVPIGTFLPEPANVLLLSVLDGVAPPGSRQLIIKGSSDSQVWLMGDKMYLRTRLTLLSPGWVGKMTSPDGMMAYELPKTSSILVSQYGEPVELKVEGF